MFFKTVEAADAISFLIFIWLHQVVIIASLAVACGIWFPDRGLNLCPLYWESCVLTTEPPGKSQLVGFKRGVSIVCIFRVRCKLCISCS